MGELPSVVVVAVFGEVPVVLTAVTIGTVFAVAVPVTVCVCAAAPADANAKQKPSHTQKDFVIFPDPFVFIVCCRDPRPRELPTCVASSEKAENGSFTLSMRKSQKAERPVQNVRSYE
jgi:hypothetical protein